MTDETRQKLDEVIQEAEADPAALTDWHLAVLRAARDRIVELEQSNNRGWQTHLEAEQEAVDLRHRAEDAEAEGERLREALTYEVNRLAASLRRLSYAAQTTGGTAGPDRDLQDAIKQAGWALGCSDTTLAALATDQPVASQKAADVSDNAACGSQDDGDQLQQDEGENGMSKMPYMHPDMKTDLDEEAFADLAAELEKARVKFPSAGNHMHTALTEEVGELAEALMRNGNNGAGHADVRKEAIQVATMAIRIVTEGDGTFGYDPTQQDDPSVCAENAHAGEGGDKTP